VVIAVVIAARHHGGDRAKLDRFCMATKMAIQEDRRDLLSDDVDAQRAAAQHFWSKEIYQGADSLAYCMDEAKVPQLPVKCPLAEDEKTRWKCLGDFAAQVEQALP
jgi:hypothetical protein